MSRKDHHKRLPTTFSERSKVVEMVMVPSIPVKVLIGASCMLGVMERESFVDIGRRGVNHKGSC
jgi:hypothetical protein